MNRTLLNRILLLDHVADERCREHYRRSTSTAAIAGTITAFVLFEYHILVEHRVPNDLLAVIYAMGAVKVALMLWYRVRN